MVIIGLLAGYVGPKFFPKWSPVHQSDEGV